jgi:hypothetical protein
MNPNHDVLVAGGHASHPLGNPPTSRQHFRQVRRMLGWPALDDQASSRDGEVVLRRIALLGSAL